MLELAILGLLKEQELHGYELKKRLSELLGLTSGVSFGSLYPALARLEAAGAVAVVDTAATGASIPLTGSLGGELAAFRARRTTSRGTRGKKVYRVTERGEELFGELLNEGSVADDVRAFTLRLSFARYLPPGARIRLLEHRRAQLVQRLGRLSTRIDGGRRRLDGYARCLVDHDREATERDISWLERLIASERGGPPATGAAETGSRVPEPPSLSPPVVTSAVVTDAAVTSAGVTTAGSYRPSLSGLRPPRPEEQATA